MRTHAILRAVTRLAAAVALSGGLLAAAVGPAQAKVPGDTTSPNQIRQPNVAAAVSYRYTLQNVNSGKCLEVAFGGLENFSPVAQYTCYGGTFQQWRLTYVAPSTYTLQNVNSSRCLDVAFGGLENFSPVVQYSCYGGPVQQWRLSYSSAYGAYTLQNVNSGKCLDVAFGGKENFSPVVQYSCYGGPVQRWKLTYLGA